MRAGLHGRRLARFLVQFANVVLSQKPVRAAVGGLSGRQRGPACLITG
ncbi:acyl-CoA hydrolase [Burkholderia stagnalis]|nr:acyl-CoA hydrolase [Burkholderia stagnalis]RQQ16557.1 acyl-CoA hydrolase [Burkholderia stagnalis]RQQ28470.1 acyl-CoA hydrolase [Burkholderia stagnalis]RQQ32181.1 acyl-CoA hydrolase [Burkholderia stagnalis]RQQ33500.1 acyl-CoA hydrolase [Burkholderia stagnalis]